MRILQLPSVFLILSWHLGCIAIPGKVDFHDHSFLSQNIPVDIVFTGFAKYQKEEGEIRNLFVESGFTFHQRASHLLEVVLEELEPRYKRKTAHTFHFLLSIGTLTIIPFHNQTEHRITIKLREKGIVINEAVLHTKFHQWRGLLLIPFTYFYWPTSEFTLFIKDSVRKMLGRNDEI